jgi:transcriptional regulator with XRE-family HTH domain
MENYEDEAVMAAIGHKLRALRKEKGFTSHEEFASAHGLPRIQYWRLEKGKANFTIKTFLKVVRIHGLTLEQFFGNPAPQNSPNT